ncbi:MAG: Nif3-like dinuclear metal center hexameric protein [Bacteroidota bacterium]
MKIRDLINAFEKVIPIDFQEDYDNCGLQIGNAQNELTQALICFDITEQVVDEAINKKCNLIISHHPLIFKGIKKITGSNYIERIIQKLIQTDVCIYCAHTSLDNNFDGLNLFIAQKLGLKNTRILVPVNKILKKLVVFCPTTHAEKLRIALFHAGAGNIGNYDSCSFNLAGTGTFRANENAHPFVGEVNKLHEESEIRIETIFPQHLESHIVATMLKNHPYEEVAYDIYSLDNSFEKAGSGVIGEFEHPMSTDDFFQFLKTTFGTQSIKHSKIIKDTLSKVAFCGGSGSFLIQDAIRQGADVFISADIKYHDFFQERILLTDIGHFESEQFSCELIATILMKKLPTFAFLFSENRNNPVYYFN